MKIGHLEISFQCRWYTREQIEHRKWFYEFAKAIAADAERCKKELDG